LGVGCVWGEVQELNERFVRMENMNIYVYDADIFV